MEKTKGDITIEEIRQFPGHENLSDDELQEIVESIIELSRILIMVNVDENISKK